MQRNEVLGASKFAVGLWLAIAIPCLLLGVPRLRLYQVFWATQVIPLLVFFPNTETDTEPEPDEDEIKWRVLNDPAIYRPLVIHVPKKEDFH